MQARLTLALALSSVLLSACGGGSNSSRAVPAPPATNPNGSPVTGVITAVFNPSASQVPLPNNLLLSGTKDLTINIPVANPNNFGDPQVAINALDGWSTVAPWSFSFSTAPKAGTYGGGTAVRMFEVKLTGPGGGVTEVVRELASPAEFVVAPQPTVTAGTALALVPTKALKQLTSYMVVVTDAVTDSAGNVATPDQTYFLTKRTSPLCTSGQSTDPLLPAATACALEPLRQLTNSQLAAAASKGITPDHVVVSWVATTQSTTAVLGAVAQKTAATPAATTHFAPTGKTLADVGAGAAIADIYIGTLDVPYYLSAPSAAAPTAPLNTFWKATAGGYIAPYNGLGLDPTSTNVTAINPFPVATRTETIPVLMTIPNAASGKTRPAAGWPIVIFQHGITGDRSNSLGVAQTLASQGFAMIAIDAPLHGITDKTSALYAKNSPLAAAYGVHERTFDIDYSNNDTGAAAPDGKIDGSGAYFINLSSLLTSRDNIRQAVADLLVLSKAIPSISYDADPGADFDASRISFVGISLGGIIGTDFTAVNPAVTVAVLNVPGGGIARLLDGSNTFGPRIRAGLAAQGVQAGTPTFDQFLGAAQQAVDSADPINFAYALAGRKVLLQEVIGTSATTTDQVIPNNVAGAPLSGTDPLIAALGLSPITATTQSATGIRGFVRFTQGEHASLVRPSNPAVTAEMQGEMASLLVSGGAAVQVTNTSVIKTQ